MTSSINNNRGILTTTQIFKDYVSFISHSGRYMMSRDYFIHFLPQMRGDWQITAGVREGCEFSHEEIVGEFGFTWNDILQDTQNFCYLKAENKRGDIIYCQF